MKLHLYKAFILPILTYCPLALSLTAPTNHLKLQVVQNKALRFVLNTRWDDFKTTQSLHEETKVLPLNIAIHYRIAKQLEKFRLHHNSMYDFIATLPPYNRHLRPLNLLDLANHEPPDPVYTRRR